MPQMEYSIEFEPVEDYLYARTTGLRTRKNVISLTQEIFEKAIALGHSKVLVDVRGLEGKLGALDSYLMVTEAFRPIRWKGLSKAAILDDRAFSVRERFSELVARNRGYDYRIFYDREHAAEWLLAE
jgi:hypothetical protein